MALYQQIIEVAPTLFQDSHICIIEKKHPISKRIGCLYIVMNILVFRAIYPFLYILLIITKYCPSNLYMFKIGNLLHLMAEYGIIVLP